MTGAVDIAGETLSANAQNGFAFAAGQTFDLETFKPGQLSGIYDTLNLDNSQGPSTNVNLGGGLTAGLVYDDALGDIQLQVVNTPTSTADSWAGGAGDWGTAADWSNGGPQFYSDVSIDAAVTLSQDATVDSLSLTGCGALRTGAGTDLSIGTG